MNLIDPIEPSYLAKSAPQQPKPVLEKPAPTKQVPDGKGLTKGDLLLRRLQFEFHHDPLSELVSLAKNNKTSISEKIKINQEFLSYIVPKLKNVEVNQHQGEVIKVNITFPDSSPEGAAATNQGTVLNGIPVE